jgi:hypothetical protein
MKKLLCMSLAVASLACATVTFAAGPRTRTVGLLGGPALLGAPAVAGSYEPQSVPPAPGPALTPEAMPMPVPAGGCELFECVKYRDCRKIAPCAVPMIVSVKDPCACCDPCNCCAAPKCVNVEICVPPCSCAEICVTRNGNKVRYCFGKYAVEITSRKGVIIVDYDA